RHDRRGPRHGHHVRLHHRRRRVHRRRDRAGRAHQRRVARPPHGQAAPHRPRAAGPRDRPPHRGRDAQRHLLRRRRHHRWHGPAHQGRVGKRGRARGRHRRPRTAHRAALPHRGHHRAVPHVVRHRLRLPPPRGERLRHPRHPDQAAAARPQGAVTAGDPAAQAARARTLNAWRRLGYRLMPGDTFSYVLHMRPAEWPIMAAHTLVGYLLAVGLHPGAIAETWGAALLGLVLWVICLNGGTLALNSAFDRDAGDIGYLSAPPPPPRHLAAFSLVLMAVGQGIALLLPPVFAIAYAACFVLSMLYSIPPVRL